MWKKLQNNLKVYREPKRREDRNKGKHTIVINTILSSEDGFSEEINILFRNGSIAVASEILNQKILQLSWNLDKVAIFRRIVI